MEARTVWLVVCDQVVLGAYDRQDSATDHHDWLVDQMGLDFSPIKRMAEGLGINKDDLGLKPVEVRSEFVPLLEEEGMKG